MKRRIFAIVLAVMFCITCFQTLCFAAYDGIGGEEHADCGHEEHEHCCHCDECEDDTYTEDGTVWADIVYEDIVDYDTDTAEIIGETTMPADFSTVTVKYAFLSSDINVSNCTLEISYFTSAVKFLNITGTLMGRDVSTYYTHDEATGKITITYPKMSSNIYNLLGTINVNFTTVDSTKKSYVTLVGTAITEAMSSSDQQVRVTMSCPVSVIFCHHIHTYNAINTASTCLKKGEEYTYCSDCNTLIGVKTLDLADHTLPENPVKITAATCKETGIAEYICSVCGKTVRKEVPAIGHTLGTKFYDSDEKVWYQKCSVCSEIVKSASQCAHPESGYTTLVATLKPATCTEKGSGVFKCSSCNVTATLDIPAKGHNYVYFNTRIQATSTTTGEEWWKCEYCGDLELRTTPKVQSHVTHTYNGKEVVILEATCTTAGKKNVYCSVEGCAQFSEVTIPAKGHTWGAWTTTKNATCTTAGSRTRTCTTCQATETESIAALGHTWGAWLVTVSPTCTTAGTKTHTCTTCQATETDTVPLSTEYCVYPEENYVVTRPATCTTPGVSECTCSVCGKTTDQVVLPIAPDAHNWSEWNVISDATCITTGERTRTCSLCGKTETETVPATGHTYTDVSSKKGTTTKVCSVCNSTEVIKTTKNGTSKSVKNGIFTLLFNDTATAEKDIFFKIDRMDSEAYNTNILPFESQLTANGLGTIEAAYTYLLKIGTSSATVASADKLVIELGEEYKKIVFDVRYLDENGALKVVSPDYITRKGTTITVDIGSGTFKYPTGTLVLVNTGAKTTNYAIPITVAILTVVIAVGVVFFVLSKNKKVSF